MLEQLIGFIKEQGKEVVGNNSSIPDEQKTAVLDEAGTAITGTIQNAVVNGQTTEVQQLFTTGSVDLVQANPLAQKAQGSFIDGITSKLGINKSTAMGIATSLIPMLLSRLVQKSNSSTADGSGFSLAGIIGSLTGGSGSGLGNMLGQITSMNNGGGGFNLSEVIDQASGEADENARQEGLADKAKGFFK